MTDSEQRGNRRDAGRTNLMDDVLHAFGAAAYNAQVMERKLIILLSAIVAARDPRTANRTYDRAFGNFDAKTLGPVIKALGQAIELPEGLDARLKRALRFRNMLIHDFFWNHAEDELSEAGRSTMLRELAEISTSFYELAGETEAVTKAFMSAFTSAVVSVRGLPQPLAEAIDSVFSDAERGELNLMRERAKWRDGQPGT